MGELQANRVDPGFQESNMKHSISGYLFGNLQGLNLTSGRDARWHIVSLVALIVWMKINTIKAIARQRQEQSYPSLAWKHSDVGSTET